MNDSKAAAALLLLGLVIFAVYSPASASAKTGIIVPLYAYPAQGAATPEWSQAIQVHQQYPTVSMLAIVEPTGPDSNYAAGITALSNSGITVLGYVWTNYGGMALSTLENIIQQDHANYPSIGGMFFDGMAYLAGSESLYSSATAYAKGLGLMVVFGNPGVTPSSSYIGTVSNIVTFENPQPPTAAGTKSFSYIANQVATFSQSAINTSYGYLYVTNDPSYLTLPPYFAQEVAALR